MHTLTISHILYPYTHNTCSHALVTGRLAQAVWLNQYYYPLSCSHTHTHHSDIHLYRVNHSKNAIVKPQGPTPSEAKREVEEAMKKVREAQMAIEGAIDPGKQLVFLSPNKLCVQCSPQTKPSWLHHFVYSIVQLVMKESLAYPWPTEMLGTCNHTD